MARSYFVNGEALVRVKAGAHISSPASMANSAAVTLGIAETGIEISPKYAHFDVLTDQQGTQVPAEIMSELVEAKIHMTLIHFDPDVLDVCLSEGLGGYSFSNATATENSAGMVLGRNQALLASGNHFMSLGITSPVASKPWRFQAAFLEQNPMEWPLGTLRSKVRLNWRAIVYVNTNGTKTNTVWDYNALA